MNNLMAPETIAAWMFAQIEREGYIYQDGVVDYLVKAKQENLLTKNADGNQVVGNAVLAAFRKLTKITLV